MKPTRICCSHPVCVAPGPEQTRETPLSSSSFHPGGESMQANPTRQREARARGKVQCGSGRASCGSCCCHPAGPRPGPLWLGHAWGTREEAGKAVWRRERRLTAKTEGMHDRDLAKELSLQTVGRFWIKIHKWSRQNMLMDKV